MYKICLPVLFIFLLNHPYSIVLGQNNIDSWSQQRLDSSNDYSRYVDDWSRWLPNSYSSQQQDQNWSGNWFPYNPNGPDQNEIIFRGAKHDFRHGVVMGESDPKCDDGQTNLNVDWDGSPINYTCFERNHFRPRSDIHPIHSTEHIPKFYSATHSCMNETIEYSEVIPTFGPHRPLWAVYGEYVFLPKQRWIHNLEHGAVVMLYHPCANPNEVKLLRSIVNACLYRHIITPFNLLSPERPLALVTWGHRLEISKVSPEVTMRFLRDHALKGPEQTSRNGQYNIMLKREAQIVTDQNDTNVCEEFIGDLQHM